MKIAVSSTAPSLDADIDRKFGRCAYVLIVETDDMRFEAVQNPYADASGGVGNRLAAFVIGRGVEAVIAGTIGPHARETLESTDVMVVTDCSGKVRDAVHALLAARATQR